MNLGLYKAKFWFRDFINFMLPYCKNIDPNLISYAVLPFGLVTGMVFFFAPKMPVLYLIGIILLFIRIVLTTLDGYVAQHFNKSTEDGEIINKFTPELCDIFLMLGIVLADPSHYTLGVFAITLSWSISFFGMLGHMIGRGGESIGPLGQTDRVVTIMIIALMQYLSIKNVWNLDFINYFLVWHLIGGMITVALRMQRTLRKCEKML